MYNTYYCIVLYYTARIIQPGPLNITQKSADLTPSITVDTPISAYKRLWISAYKRLQGHVTTQTLYTQSVPDLFFQSFPDCFFSDVFLMCTFWPVHSHIQRASGERRGLHPALELAGESETTH